mmetsp:Transcript_3120/g.5944  ORF Transcript_3120/g.5944 Transcript_3120/m.5944 type:complete len:124 (-) Transcript_3120:71-442(-)
MRALKISYGGEKRKETEGNDPRTIEENEQNDERRACRLSSRKCSGRKMGKGNHGTRDLENLGREKEEEGKELVSSDKVLNILGMGTRDAFGVIKWRSKVESLRTRSPRIKKYWPFPDAQKRKE